MPTLGIENLGIVSATPTPTQTNANPTQTNANVTATDATTTDAATKNSTITDKNIKNKTTIPLSMVTRSKLQLNNATTLELPQFGIQSAELNNTTSLQLQKFGLPTLSLSVPPTIISKSITDLPPAPKSIKDAISTTNPFHLQWKHAIDKEMMEMISRDVFKSLSRRQRNKARNKAIPSMFVFRATRELDNTVKFKARLVALGNKQIKHINYERHSSPTLSMRNFNIIVCISTILGWDGEHIDVGNAYLEALAEDELYMTLPKQYTDNKIIEVKLGHNIYGLKQAGLLWFQLVDNVLKDFNFTRSVFDPCTYTYEDNNSNKMIIGIFVDDIVLFGNNQDILTKFKNYLSSKFKKVTFKGPLKVFLGIELNTINNHIHLTQIDTTLSYCKDNNINKEKITNIPLPIIHDLKSKLYGEENPIHKEIGQIGWLLHTRPELGYSRSLLAQFNLHPSVYCRKIISNVFSYAYQANSKNLSLKLGGQDTLIEPFCYTDASYVKDGDSKSQHGQVWFLTKDSGAIFTTSQKSKVVATSSTDSEINALFEATKTAIWLRGYLGDLGHYQIRPTIIYQDNTSVILLMDNINNEANSKHCIEKINFIRQEIQRSTISLVHMPTENMIADILTKPLAKEKFNQFRDIILNGHNNTINNK